MYKLWICAIVFMKTAEIVTVDVQENDNESNSIEIENTGMVINKIYTRHAFFRIMDAGKTPTESQARRVFGGAAAELKDFPSVCALLDRYFTVRCTATVLAPHWVVTAAHCISPRLAYVKYNTRRPSSNEGNLTAVEYLYQHPRYEVIEKDEGRGIDVITLHHDIGLVRTRDDIKLAFTPNFVLASLRRNNPDNLFNQEVKVLGFGRTERSVLGEELFSVQLQLQGCERSEWTHCVCGVAQKDAARGVCSGDSGGPVLYKGLPIGVTSMGPVECAQMFETPVPGATSVFTSLYPYSDLINATINETEAALRMRIIARASCQCSHLLSLALCLIVVR